MEALKNSPDIHRIFEVQRKNKGLKAELASMKKLVAQAEAAKYANEKRLASFKCLRRILAQAESAGFEVQEASATRRAAISSTKRQKTGGARARMNKKTPKPTN